MCSGLQLEVLGHHRFLLLRSLCGRLGGRSRCASRSAHLCARLPTFESNCPAWWKVPVNDFASGSQLATEQTSVDSISKQSPRTETSPPFLAHGIAIDSHTLMVTGLCVPSRLHCPSSPGVEREDVIAKARRPRLLKPGSLLGLNTPRKSCICFPKPGRGISAPKRDPGRWPLAALSGAANEGQLWMTTEDPLGFDSMTV